MKRLSCLLVLLSILLASCSLNLLSQEDALGTASDFSGTVISDAGDFLILLISDTHEGRVKSVYTDYYTQLTNWLKSSSPFQAAFLLGDITNDATSEQYASALSKYGGMNSSVYVTAGNHDVRKNGRNLFLSTFGKVYQKVIIGGISFYLLDSSFRCFGKAQLDKLKQALKQDGNPKFFLTHMPLAGQDVNYYYLCLSDSDERKLLLALMKENNVNLYLAGHRHLLMDTVTYSDTCHEVDIGPLNGKNITIEQPPNWYTLSYNSTTKEATITQYIGQGNSVEQHIVGTFIIAQ